MIFNLNEKFAGTILVLFCERRFEARKAVRTSGLLLVTAANGETTREAPFTSFRHEKRGIIDVERENTKYGIGEPMAEHFRHSIWTICSLLSYLFP